MKRLEQPDAEQPDAEQPSDQDSFRPATKVFDFRQMRATDLSFNQRVKLPNAVNEDMEIKMQGLEDELRKITVAMQTKLKGASNMTMGQQSGLRSLKHRVRTNDIVVFQTDKSGRFSVDTPESYRNTVQPHVCDDPGISRSYHDAIEKLLNAHESGPPSLPVCGANASANYRLSHLLSLVLSEVWQRDRTGTVCMNTKERLAEVEQVNAEGLGDRVVIGSTDVKALYSSLDIEFTIQVVCEIFGTSDVNILGIDYQELGLYISLSRTPEEIRAVGLEEVFPTRAQRRGPKSTITASGSAARKEVRFQSWRPATSAPSRQQQRTMLVEALRIGLEVVMENHVYKFDGSIHRQQRGGAMGLELTGNLAQVFMMWWDCTFKSRLSDLGIVTRLCKRYVDDVNMAAGEVPAGTRFIEGQLVVDEMAIESDLLVPGDRQTMEVMKSVGNSIHPSIQLEIDCPSNHDDGKMLSLDLKLHIRDVGGARRSFTSSTQKLFHQKQ
eukprot:gene13423-14802_t